MKLLLFTVAFGIGEGLAACWPEAARAWPFFMLLSVIAVLFGYAFKMRAWPCLFACLVGIALFLRAAVPGEEMLRERPWMRHARIRAESPEESGLRRDLARRVGLGLADRQEAASLNRAILLGERARMSASTKRVFVESGTIHVFAISGLHVMVVAKTLAVLLALLLVPRRLAGLVAIPLLWAYVALVGFPPSAVRAALMATFYFAAPACWRRPDALRAWCLAFLFVQAFDPLKITHVGSLLSFVVMLALVIGGRIARAFGSKLWETLFMTFVAWAAGTPIAAMAFGRVTPGGLLANLMLVPAAGCTVSTGALGMLVSYVSCDAAVYLNNLAALGTDAMVAVAQTVARLPGANFEEVGWTLPGCLVWYAGLGAFMWCACRATRPKPL